MIFSNETRRLEEARRVSACRTPSAVNPPRVAKLKVAVQQRLRLHVLSRGGGVSSKPIRERLSRAADSPTREAYDSAGIHAGYCTEAEYARFGGTDVCPAVGELPGGRQPVRSLYQGAGTADTPAALTGIKTD